MSGDWMERERRRQMSKNQRLMADVKARRERAAKLAEERGHLVTDTQFQQAGQSVVGFCDRCGKDIWIKRDGETAGDILSAACSPKP